MHRSARGWLAYRCSRGNRSGPDRRRSLNRLRFTNGFRCRTHGYGACRRGAHSGYPVQAVGQMRLGARLWLRCKMGFRCGFSLKDSRDLGLGGRLCFQKWGNKIVAAFWFYLEQERLAFGRGGLFKRKRFGLRRVAAAHNGFVQTLFDDLARGCFQHHLMAQDCGAIGLLVEVGFDAIGLFAGQQARIQPPMG